MNMISTLRRKFTSGNSVPVERVSITVEEYDQLQEEWIKRVTPEGYALVPIEPTESMMNAAGDVFQTIDSDQWDVIVKGAYHAMLKSQGGE